MRPFAALLLTLVLMTVGAPMTARAQQAEITVEDCVAFEITADIPLCCYAFRLCIENVALPPVSIVGLELLNAEQCVPPSAPDGWEVNTAGSAVVEWEADPGDEIIEGVTVCGFGFSSTARTVQLRVTLVSAGVPVFEQDLEFTCGDDCPVPVEAGTWGRIKAIYSD